MRILILAIISGVLCQLYRVAAAAAPPHNILDFGAMPDDDSLTAEQANTQALVDAIVAANYTTDGGSREVLIPAGHSFNTFGVFANYFNNVTITIDGNLVASKRHHMWPISPQMEKVKHVLNFEDVHNITIRGQGQVDGQGFMWWLREFLQRNTHGRPRLLVFERCTNIELTGVRWVNSPDQTIDVRDVDGLYAHDFEIWTDHKGQLELGKLLLGDQARHGLNGMTLPMFPLNTDGIDPSGKNILIERLNITNYDDAVVIKPMNRRKGKYSTCSENIIVRDINVWFGVGMSLGTVAPDDGYNCIRNVQFHNIKFYHPFKAIYIKTNPGTTPSMLPGSGGEISNILYEDIEIHRPIWWSIYIGPQQQKQPDHTGPGCMLYPFGGECDTQPLIDIKNVTLRNINQYGAVLPYPGIIRCNETNPCTDFTFENVKSHGIWTLLGFNYIVENVLGDVVGSRPVPPFAGIRSSPIQVPTPTNDFFASWVSAAFAGISKAQSMMDLLELYERPAQSVQTSVQLVAGIKKIFTRLSGSISV